MHTKSLLTFILLVLFAGLTASAQTTLPAATADRTQMLIGEQAHITLSIEWESNGDDPLIEFPYLQDTLVRDFEIVDVSPVDTLQPSPERQPNLFQLSQKYTVTSFDTGQYVLHRFPVVVNGDTLRSNPLTFTIYPMVIDTTQQAVFDIKDIYEINLSFLDYFNLYGWYVLIAIIVITAIVMLWYFMRRRKHKEEEEPSEPEVIVPPHEIALAALRNLEQQMAWQTADIKTYHSELTDIIRTYIEERFMVPAMEQTTGEIIKSLRYSELSQASMLRLTNLLRMADMVKFAREHPGEEDNLRSLQSAIALVEETKLIEEEESETKEDNKEQDAG